MTEQRTGSTEPKTGTGDLKTGTGDLKTGGLEQSAGATAQDALPARRRRYARSPSPPGLMALTPGRLQLLEFLAECRFLSLPQLARLARPLDRNEAASQKSARRHLRALFDAGLVDVLPVSRPALAAADAANDATLLYGSAPNVYAPTARGLDLLVRVGRLEAARRPGASYGPLNSLFLAHELMVRDARVWLQRLAACSQGAGGVRRWVDGTDAAIDLLGPDGRSGPGTPRQARPDAWFVYRVRQDRGGRDVVLVGLVEADRGTERGTSRWNEKLAAYGTLFGGERLSEVTGYRKARVLVLTPDAARRDRLGAFIAREAGSSPLADRFWLAAASDLEAAGLDTPVWRHGLYSDLLPLVP